MFRCCFRLFFGSPCKSTLALPQTPMWYVEIRVWTPKMGWVSLSGFPKQPTRQNCPPSNSSWKLTGGRLPFFLPFSTSNFVGKRVPTQTETFYLRSTSLQDSRSTDNYRQWKIHCCDSTYRARLLIPPVPNLWPRGVFERSTPFFCSLAEGTDTRGRAAISPTIRSFQRSQGILRVFFLGGVRQLPVRLACTNSAPQLYNTQSCLRGVWKDSILGKKEQMPLEIIRGRDQGLLCRLLSL